MQTLQRLCLYELTVSGQWLVPANQINTIVPARVIPDRQDFEFNGYYGEIYIHVHFIPATSLMHHIKFIEDISIAMGIVDRNVHDKFAPIHITTSFPQVYYFWFWKIFDLYSCDPKGLSQYLISKIKGLERFALLTRLRRAAHLVRLAKPMTA